MSDSEMSGDRPAAGGSRRPIRLLEIIGNAIVGGMESYTRNLIASLPADEYDVTCILPYESPYSATLRALGCRVYITPIHDDPVWRSIEMAMTVVRHHEIDIIHANLANAHTLAGIVGRMTGTPTVATIHARGFWIQELSVTRLTDTHLITVCQEAQAQALATGVPADRLSLIPNGVDTDRFTPARSGEPFRASIGIGPDTPLVGFVGRISWEKGPDKFVHMAHRVNQQLPGVHFAMVGEGPVEPDMLALIEHLGMAERIHMVGLRRDVENVYPAFDLLVQTSRTEAMPLALLEAMASGVPLVAIAVGGIAEIVEGGTTGILVSAAEGPGVASPYPGDWEGAARAALDLLRQPDRLASMGRAGRARAEVLFDLKRTVRETDALFRRLLPAARAKGAGLLQPVPMVRDKTEGRVRLKGQGGAEPPRSGFAAVRAVESS